MGMDQRDKTINAQEGLFDVFLSFMSGNTDDIFLMLDPEAERIEYISPNVERVLGVSEAEALADPNSIRMTVSADVDPVDFVKLRELKPGESLEPALIQRVSARTQESLWFRDLVSCVDLRGKKKIVAYLSDRTQEQQTQDALSEALDMAQAANKAKTSFLGSVSHDIRTPMNAIMGLTMLLKEEADNPELVLEYTRRIDVASQHLLGLINDVLDMNKIEDGSATLNVTELTPDEIIEGLNTIIRPQAEAKNQQFEISVSPFACEHLLGDKLRINQILINILSNSVKYTQEGGRIELRVTEMPQRVKDHSHIQFVVRDNGQGMSEEYLKVIFDPFTREDSRTHLIQGTGLGMAITKSLVDLMGGSIQVDSVLDEGSTFTVELDLRIQKKAVRSGARKEKAAPGSVDGSVISGKHFLVVDDVEVNRLILVKILGTLGATCDIAENGKLALDKFAASRPGEFDIILMDVQMPVMDGHEATRAIRACAHPEAKSVSIIAMTANAFVDDVRDALAAGMDAHVSKPIVLDQLKRTIQEILARKGQNKE